MASLLGPVIGVLGKEVEGVGTLVHALPAVGPVASAVTASTGQAVTDVTVGTVGGVGEALGGVAAAVKDLASSTPSVIGGPPAEAGHQTSEFKMTAVKSLVLAIFGALAAFGVAVPERLQGLVLTVVPIAIAVLGAAYSISRGLRKRSTA